MRDINLYFAKYIVKYITNIIKEIQDEDIDKERKRFCDEIGYITNNQLMVRTGEVLGRTIYVTFNKRYKNKDGSMCGHTTSSHVLEYCKKSSYYGRVQDPKDKADIVNYLTVANNLKIISLNIIDNNDNQEIELSLNPILKEIYDMWTSLSNETWTINNKKAIDSLKIALHRQSGKTILEKTNNKSSNEVKTILNDIFKDLATDIDYIQYLIKDVDRSFNTNEKFKKLKIVYNTIDNANSKAMELKVANDNILNNEMLQYKILTISRNLLALEKEVKVKYKTIKG